MLYCLAARVYADALTPFTHINVAMAASMMVM